MHNLYSRLGIDPAASAEQIRQAISVCTNLSLREDAQEVLLTPDRRRAYDRIHFVLEDIGHLRACLGLNHADNWQGPQAINYTQDSIKPDSKYEGLLRKVKAVNRRIKVTNSIKGLFAGLFRLVAVLAFFAGVIWVLDVSDDVSTSNQRDRSGGSNPDSAPNKPAFVVVAPSQPTFNKPALVAQSQPTFNKPAQPLPWNGAIRNHTSASRVAPLEIKTSLGSNYLVKLEDASSKQNVMDVFVRGGNTVEIEVPLGSYLIKYASGEIWYGYQYNFGPEGSYNKADQVFHFRVEGQQISGYTITLYRVSDGNLSITQINPAEF